MEQILVHLIAGTLGGHIAARISPAFDLGPTGTTCAGLAGGSGFGLLISALLPTLTAATTAGDVNLAGSLTHIATAGVGGAILVVMIGSLQNGTA